VNKKQSRRELTVNPTIWKYI